jgi:ABC-type multidrug transport system fused ATPase/permease subunit
MDNGEIIGEGTHEELSKSNPIYENYVRLQFSENDA